MIVLIPFALSILLIPLAFSVSNSFDALLKQEYLSHRADWEHDGMPSGYSWRPKDAKFPSSYFAGRTLSLAWLFATPRWAAGDVEATLLLLKIRTNTILFFAVGLLMLLSILFLYHYA